jgi:hypothetical protein
MTDPEMKNPAQEETIPMSLDEVARMLQLDRPKKTLPLPADAAEPDEFAAMKAQPDVELVRSNTSQEGYVNVARLRLHCTFVRHIPCVTEFRDYTKGYVFPPRLR